MTVSINFPGKDPPGVSDISYILSHTGPNDSVLKPPIGPFYLTLGLGRQGIRHLNIAVIHYLFPLWISLIRQEMVFSPQ